MELNSGDVAEIGIGYHALRQLVDVAETYHKSCAKNNGESNNRTLAIYLVKFVLDKVIPYMKHECLGQVLEQFQNPSINDLEAKCTRILGESRVNLYSNID